MGLEGEQMQTKNHNIHAEKVLRPIKKEFPDFSLGLSVRCQSEA